MDFGAHSWLLRLSGEKVCAVIAPPLATGKEVKTTAIYCDTFQRDTLSEGRSKVHRVWEIRTVRTRPPHAMTRNIHILSPEEKSSMTEQVKLATVQMWLRRRQETYRS